jgi:N-acetylmuramic acid 6-phosphate etherase
MVLNMISTASLIRLGYVSGNRMTNVHARNSKLNERALRILIAETGLSEVEARSLFDAAGNMLPLAITMSKSGADRVSAELALKRADGKIDSAVADLLRPDAP